jgi:hypothetical protein
MVLGELREEQALVGWQDLGCFCAIPKSIGVTLVYGHAWVVEKG